jgi:hypothetical protein
MSASLITEKTYIDLKSCGMPTFQLEPVVGKCLTEGNDVSLSEGLVCGRYGRSGSHLQPFPDLF